MRNYPCSNKTFIEFLQEVKENALNAYDNQDMPFELLVEKLNVKRDISRNPIFDTMFAMQNIDNTEINLKDFSVNLYTDEYEYNISKLDLSLIAWEYEDKIYMSLEYCTKLFSKETINSIIVNYIKIIDNVVENNFISINDIKINPTIAIIRNNDIEDIDIDLDF